MKPQAKGEMQRKRKSESDYDAERDEKTTSLRLINKTKQVIDQILEGQIAFPNMQTYFMEDKILPFLSFLVLTEFKKKKGKSSRR